jgi:hypothetical protein
VSGRRLVGVVFGAAGLAIIASASAHPPMSGCPPAVDDPSAMVLTGSLTMDYCAGSEPAESARRLFVLLNAVGGVAFLGGVTLLSFRNLVGRTPG